jgi:hypothetical protein
MISISERFSADCDFASVVRGSYEPKIVVKLSHEPSQVAHPSGNVLIDIAAISYSE